MDLSDPEVWKNGVRVVVDAPHVVFPLLALVAGAAWWFKAALNSAQIENLQTQVGLLKDRIELEETRRKYVEDRLDVGNKQLQQALHEIEELKHQIQTGAAIGQLFDKANSTATVLGTTITANTELGKILRAEPGNLQIVGGNVKLKDAKP
jgi:hypothetical protein